MPRIDLKLGKRSYPILIGTGVVKRLPDYLRARQPTKIFIVSDVRLHQARKRLKETLSKQKIEVVEILVEAGESLKDFKSVFPIYGQLLQNKGDRNALLIALGGGSVGDAAGFVAATYLRGIEWWGAPTTLLAQVDSSVGGKTGINHPAGKNLIGAFHQPSLVLCDLDYLKTLSQREMISGLGEIAKIALTFDPRFFKFLDSNLEAILAGDPALLEEAITRSLNWKCKQVARDEEDRTGLREVLNFGHTFGHALESATRYRRYQHGEAVIWGMRFALALSEIRGHLSSRDRVKLDSFLRRLPVPPIPKKLERDFILGFMKKDKKSDAGRIRFVLLDRLGHSVSDSKVSQGDLHQAYSMVTEGGGAHG